MKNISGISNIATGYNHSLVRKNDGTAWNWGWNYYGQLGDSTTTEKHTPIKVNGLCQIKSVVQDYDEPLVISLVPNPSNGKFIIQNYDLKLIKYHLEIYNSIGVRVYKSPILNQKTELDISTLTDGIYFLYFHTIDKSFTQKIIIQK